MSHKAVHKVMIKRNGKIIHDSTFIDLRLANNRKKLLTQSYRGDRVEVWIEHDDEEQPFRRKKTCGRGR